MGRSEGLSQKIPCFLGDFFWGFQNKQRSFPHCFTFAENRTTLGRRWSPMYSNLLNWIPPRKMNGWNLKITHLQWKIIFQTSIIVFQPLIFHEKSNRNPVVHLECRNSEISHVFFCFVGVSVYSSFMGVLRGA